MRFFVSVPICLRLLSHARSRRLQGDRPAQLALFALRDFSPIRLPGRHHNLKRKQADELRLNGFLVDLDSSPWGAISRVALGLAMLPVFRALSGGNDRL